MSNFCHWKVGELAFEFADKTIFVCVQSAKANSAPPVIVAVGNGFIVTEIDPLAILVQPNPFVAMTL